MQIIDSDTNTTLFKGRERNGTENDVTFHSEGSELAVRFDVPDEQLSNVNLTSVDIWIHTGWFKSWFKSCFGLEVFKFYVDTVCKHACEL